MAIELDGPGPLLGRMREATGVSAAEMARALGVNQSTVFRLERRRGVQSETAHRYVAALEGCLAQRRERERAVMAKVAELAVLAGAR